MKQNPKFKIDNSKLTRLVAKAQKGNEKATEEVVNMISGYLYYYSLTLLGDDDKARDAVQDILLTMLQKLNTLENPKAFLGWMKTMTSHYCHNKVTRAKNHSSLDELTETEDFSEQICPSKPLEAKETCALVRQAVNALPVLLRESVMMHYFHQMSVREIAQTLEVNENTVKSRLFSARKSMKKYLEEFGGAALASCLIPPMKLISFSLIHEAETKQGILIPFATPSGAIKVASLNAAAASAVPVKITAAACAALLAVGGAGAAAAMFAPQRSHTAVVATEPPSRPYAPAETQDTEKQIPNAVNQRATLATVPPSVTQPVPTQAVTSPTVPAQTQPATQSTVTATAAAAAATPTVPPTAPPATAAPVATIAPTTQPAEKKVYLDTSVWTLSSQVFCHIYDSDGNSFYPYGGKSEYCTKLSDKLYSYDFSGLDLKDGTAYYLVFGSAKGATTNELPLTAEHYGGTALFSEDSIYGNMDSELKTYTLFWK